MAKRKTKIATLEIDSEEPETGDETTDTVLESAQPETAEEETKPAPLTTEQENDARRRKEQVLREAQTELDNLEDEQADARKEVNSYKKPIADARSKVRRLISCDVHGFLQWEREQELPLLRSAEEAANAWKNEPVDKLDVTAKDREHLAEHFVTCGNVADWLGKDFPDKKKGLNGQATKERLRNAIQKISGVFFGIPNSGDEEDRDNDD